MCLISTKEVSMLPVEVRLNILAEVKLIDSKSKQFLANCFGYFKVTFKHYYSYRNVFGYRRDCCDTYKLLVYKDGRLQLFLNGTLIHDTRTESFVLYDVVEYMYHNNAKLATNLI